jgi:tRNA(adenine34) deaminase
MDNDIFWMRQALILADYAALQQEVPVGALIVLDGNCVARAWNQPIQSHDPCAHAEILAIRRAAAWLHNYRLNNASLYVTLEPCVMCAGAIIQARIARVVFGAYDAKAGAAGSRFDVLRDTRHNHLVECKAGVLAAECGQKLSAFFQAKRDILTKK